MEKTKCRSGTYQGTFNNDADGKDKIKDIQQSVVIFNLQEKLEKLQNPSYRPRYKRVNVFGRLGKNNLNAFKYRCSGNYRRIRREDAATLDVYINS